MENNDKTIVTPTSDGGIQVQLFAQASNMAKGMPNPSEVANFVDVVKQTEELIYPSYYNETDLKSGDAFLKELGDVVIQEYEVDETSRKEWIDKALSYMRLFRAYMDPKSYPWPQCSNVHLPLLTTTVLQFCARAYEAIMPAKGAVQVLTTEIPAISDPQLLALHAQRADRIERYMNTQLYYEMPQYEEDWDKMLIELAIVGSSFKKTFYDKATDQIQSRFVSAFDLVFNYGYKNIEEAPRASHVIYLYPNDIRKRVRVGAFCQSAWDLKSGNPTTNTFNNRIKNELDRLSGMSKPGTEYVSPRCFIEQHREVCLDGSGIAKPYVVTVDYETREVVRITDRTTLDAFGKEINIEYFTQYDLIPDPTGGYGIGFGTLMGGLNESAITLLNEIIDAGSLANIQGGFVTKRSGIKKGSLTFGMGEFKEVETYVDDIRKAIYHMDFKGPNNTLYAVLGLLYEYAKLVSSVSETMTGQLPASDTPASTVMALLEEGRKVFSSIHKRIHRSFKKELRKIYRLDSIFLNEAKYFAVLTEAGVPSNQMLPIGRGDFTESYDVMPVSDPSIISRAEKLIISQKQREIILTDPISMNNPENIYNATRRFLETMGTVSISEIYSPPQANKPIDRHPAEENSMFITEKPSDVLPGQDHLQHLQVHEDLVTGTFASQLTPAGRHILEAHQQQHKAGLYLNTRVKEQNQL